ncbi:MAG: hypothetical protein CTY32_02590, partial [Methylotenera sp.]
VALARLASFFLLLSQKKETKEKATLYRLFPRITYLTGVSGNSPIKIIGSNSRLPKTPVKYVILGAVARG